MRGSCKEGRQESTEFSQGKNSSPSEMVNTFASARCDLKAESLWISLQFFFTLPSATAWVLLHNPSVTFIYFTWWIQPLKSPNYFVHRTKKWDRIIPVTLKFFTSSSISRLCWSLINNYFWYMWVQCIFLKQSNNSSYYSLHLHAHGKLLLLKPQHWTSNSSVLWKYRKTNRKLIIQNYLLNNRKANKRLNKYDLSYLRCRLGIFCPTYKNKWEVFENSLLWFRKSDCILTSSLH